MLIELEQALVRLHRFGLSSSRAARDLTGLHNLYAAELARIASCTNHPHVMHILSEEAIERLVQRMNALGIPDDDGNPAAPAYWRRYLEAVRGGELLDTDYVRYLRAVKLALFFLDQSYLSEEVDQDYKTQRYTYASSNTPMPGWFDPGKVLGILEEIVTAYGFLWFSVVDYAEGVYRQAKGA